MSESDRNIDKIKITTLDPGHFHASLLQKNMYDQVSPTAYVYAAKESDIREHLTSIERFNNRTLNPTHWKEKVYTGPDYWERMIKEKPGNLVILAGNNKKKIHYIKSAIDAGLNVLADKPMCINKTGFELLKDIFTTAEEKGVLLYDIMTERNEITSILQKELCARSEIFGKLSNGTQANPAIIMESVHHFFKYVGGNPVKRPAWYFDVNQAGEGIVDVTTHLVDLVQWTCFPEQIIDYKTHINVYSAKHWPTQINRRQFEKITQLSEYPDYLKVYIKNDKLNVYSNGEMNYTINGVHARVKIDWKFQAPEGSSDTFYSIIRGTKSNIIIRQDAEQNSQAKLYIEPEKKSAYNELKTLIKKAIYDMQISFPGIKTEESKGQWHIIIPDKYRIGHEAHFAQTAKRYLRYLAGENLPPWEVPNMIAKYYTTTQALEMVKE